MVSSLNKKHKESQNQTHTQHEKYTVVISRGGSINKIKREMDRLENNQPKTKAHNKKK